MITRLELAAARIGDLAAARLTPRPEPGSVESVYRSAVNVGIRGGGRVCLQPAGTPLHPYSVTVPAARHDLGAGAAFLGACRGEAVFLSRQAIEFAGGRLSISLGGAEVWDSRLEPVASHEAGRAGRIREGVWRGVVAAAGDDLKAGQVTSHFLRAAMEHGGTPLERDRGLDGLMADATRGHLAALSEALGARRVAGLETLLERLVGFGGGLTPSGDDFLLGLLAASRFLSTAAGRDTMTATVAGVLPTLAAATTSESCRMLEAAVAGHYPEPILGLLHAAGENDGEGVRRWAGCLGELGATSGQDMLAGVLFWLDACGET